nr:transposase [Mycolicibacterium sp. TY66]
MTHTSFPYVFCDATFCKVRVGGARGLPGPGGRDRRVDRRHP